MGHGTVSITTPSWWHLGGGCAVSTAIASRLAVRLNGLMEVSVSSLWMDMLALFSIPLGLVGVTMFLGRLWRFHDQHHDKDADE